METIVRKDGADVPIEVGRLSARKSGGGGEDKLMDISKRMDKILGKE